MLISLVQILQACHQCEGLCGEGFWGLGAVWKAPVLVNKDTQKMSRRTQLAGCRRPAVPLRRPPVVKGRTEHTCVCSCFPYPCIHSYCQSMWRCQWWPLSWACCRCQLKEMNKGEEVVILLKSQHEQRKRRWVQNSRKEPYSYGEVGTLPVETCTVISVNA